MYSQLQYNKIGKRIILFMYLLVISLILLNSLVYAQEQDHNQNDLEFEELKETVALNPELLYEKDIAQLFFTTDPEQATFYPEQAREYLLSLEGFYGPLQRKVLYHYLKQSSFMNSEDIKLGDHYFVDGVSVQESPKAFSTYLLEKERIVINMPMSVHNLDFYPPGKLYGINGDLDLNELKDDFTFEVTQNGEIILVDKTKTEHTFTGSLQSDAQGGLILKVGEIDGIPIKDGSDIYFSGTTITGTFATVKGVTFQENTDVNIDSIDGRLILSDYTVIQNIAGDVTIIGEEIDFPGDKKETLLHGSVSFKDGKLVSVGKYTAVMTNGFYHQTGKEVLHLGRRLPGKNYFLLTEVNGKPVIEASGKLFESYIIDRDEDFPLPPKNTGLDNEVIGRLGITARVGIGFDERGGKVQLFRVSGEDEPLSLQARASGYFSIFNGNLEATRDDVELPNGVRKRGVFDVMYERPITGEGILTGVDMRIEYLDQNRVRTFDMNIDTTQIQPLTELQAHRLQKEIGELTELQNFILGNLNKGEYSDEPIGVMWVDGEAKDMSSYDYLVQDALMLKRSEEQFTALLESIEEQIAERQAQIDKGQQLVLPVFGEVITTSPQVRVSSSQFFSNQNINTKAMQIAGMNTDDKGAAFIFAARDYKKRIDYDAAAEASANELAREGYYALIIKPSIFQESEYLKEGRNFLEILTQPGLSAIDPELKIDKVEVHSHSWPTALKLTDEERFGEEKKFSDEVEEYLIALERKELYGQYVRKTDIRTQGIMELEDDQISAMKEHLRDDVLFEYRGCFVNPFFPGYYAKELTPSLATNIKLGVPVAGSPVGTTMMVYKPQEKRWRVVDPNNQPTPQDIRNGWFKAQPSPFYSQHPYVQDMFPDYQGYITLHDAPLITDDKGRERHLVLVSYTKKDGTKVGPVLLDRIARQEAIKAKLTKKYKRYYKISEEEAQKIAEKEMLRILRPFSPEQD